MPGQNQHIYRPIDRAKGLYALYYHPLIATRPPGRLSHWVSPLPHAGHGPLSGPSTQSYSLAHPLPTFDPRSNLSVLCGPQCSVMQPFTAVASACYLSFRFPPAYTCTSTS